MRRGGVTMRPGSRLSGTRRSNLRTSCFCPAICPWPETTVNFGQFVGSVDVGDGMYPYAGVVLDAQGNLYGTTAVGGTHGDGAVYKLDTTGKETVLYSFGGTAGDGLQIPTQV